MSVGHLLDATFAFYASIKSTIHFNYSILLSPNFAYDSCQYLKKMEALVDTSRLKKTYYICNGYGDKFEEEFAPSIQKAIAILRTKKNICVTYEKLNITSHSDIWLEGLYKGLYNRTKKNYLKK